MSPSAVRTKTWATLLTNPEYLPGLLALHRTLRAVSTYPLLVLTIEGLPESCRKVLHYVGLRTHDVPHLLPPEGHHPGFNPQFSRLKDAWTKLQVFGVTGYERIIMIDSDMIFLRSMDELFDLELPGDDWIAGVPACICNPLKLAHYPADWTPANCQYSRQSTHETLDSPATPPADGPRTSHLLNSGLVVLQPSQQLLNKLIHFLNNSPSVAQANLADQDVLAEAFQGKWRPLPWWANALKTLRAVHQDVWADTEVRLIHYILDKPWAKRPVSESSSNGHTGLNGRAPSPKSDRGNLSDELLYMVRHTASQDSVTEYAAVHAWWWVVYEEVLAELKAGDDEIWRIVDEGVAH